MNFTSGRVRYPQTILGTKIFCSALFIIMKKGYIFNSNNREMNPITYTLDLRPIELLSTLGRFLDILSLSDFVHKIEPSYPRVCFLGFQLPTVNHSQHIKIRDFEDQYVKLWTICLVLLTAFGFFT